MRLSDGLYREARALIANRLGLDFPEGRQADLERGLVCACRAASISAPERYLSWLAALPHESPEWRRLAGYLAVGETHFFRDRCCFAALERDVLPSLIATRRTEGVRRLRLWSAGCASGEEPYSLAILLDRLLPDRADWTLTILATDINPEALQVARRGFYRTWSLRETPSWIQDRQFHRRGAQDFELDPRIRQMVTFALLNLVEESYPAIVTNTNAMDLILCRNVLMYFTPEAQRLTAGRFQRTLVAGGWLVVSPAEAAAELFRPLAPVSLPGAVLFRKDQPSEVPLLPVRQAETLAAGPPAHSADVAGRSVTPVTEEPTEVTRDTRTILQGARALADQGRLEQARQLCEAALAENRLDPEAHLLMAAISQERGEIPAAQEALRRAIYLAPDFAPAHFLLSGLLLRQGKRARGRRCLETVVRLLSAVPRDETVPGSDGLTAGRLLATARAYLASS